MTPLRDAVGFVDSDERGWALGEHLGEAGYAHALGGDEEKVERAVEVVAAGCAGGLAVEAGVDAGDAQAKRGELAGLVVHESDEGRDNETSSVVSGGSDHGTAAGERGELVAEALAGAGGHDEENVAAGGCGFAHIALVNAKVAVTEDAVEELGKGFGECGPGMELCLCSHNLRRARRRENRSEYVDRELIRIGSRGSWCWSLCRSLRAREAD